MDTNEWFATWFDTKYYHLLYQNHNDEEARQFIDALLGFIQPGPSAKMLDVACGKGRHACYLNELGFEVVGMDLSKRCIEEANKNANDRLRYYEHDVRIPFPEKGFNYAVNLFTSFGYFEQVEEHETMLLNIYNSLAPKGVFVLDFFQLTDVQQHLCSNHVERRGAIEFTISKEARDHRIIKTIEVRDGMELHRFQESVYAFDASSLTNLVEQVGFKVKSVHGNYNLDALDDQSSRVIIIAERNS